MQDLPESQELHDSEVPEAGRLKTKVCSLCLPQGYTASKEMLSHYSFSPLLAVTFFRLPVNINKNKKQSKIKVCASLGKKE